MTQAESIWKLVIILDVNALEVRYHYLQTYLGDTESRCSKTTGNVQILCRNVLQLLQKDNEKLTTLITLLKKTYKVTHQKRGLINVIGTISKTLFGTMDADDEKNIEEQMRMLADHDKVLKHAVTSQVKVLNATIAHIDKLEKILAYNENLIMNTTKRMDRQLAIATQREDMDEHLLILSTITNEVIRDIEDVFDYLMNAQRNIIVPRLFPVEEVIAALKETATQLTEGLHFPFKIQEDNWRTIQKYVTMTAYHDEPLIYTILRIPVVTYPTYKLIRPTSFPVHEKTSIFSFINTNHPLLAISRENRQYKLLDNNDMNKCIENTNVYTCEKNFPTYNTDINAPCEVQIYTQTPGQLTHCDKQRVISYATLWIALTEENAWLYSTPSTQEIKIKCGNRIEEKIVINKTGKIVLKENCMLTTPQVVLRTQKMMRAKYIQTYLPQYNLTAEYQHQENNVKTKNRNEMLKPIINDPSELTKLSVSLDEISENLSEDDAFPSKYVIYPVGSSLIVIIIGAIIIVLCLKRNITFRKPPVAGHTSTDTAIIY